MNIRSMLVRSATVAAALATAPLAVSLSAQQAQAAAPQPVPEILFRVPIDGSSLPSTFPVIFALRNYGVAPAGVDLKGTGHFHILINVDAPAPGVAIPVDSLHRHYGGGQIETKLTLAPGTYTLRAVLGDHEHKVISPELVSRPIRITVRP